VAESAEVRRSLPALAELAGLIADPAVRHRGTMGGSVSNADPAADYPSALLALDAVIVTTARDIAADEFFLGLFETVLARDEIVTAVRFKIPERAAYQKFRHPASGYAVAGVMVAKFADGARVGVTGAGPGPFRVPAMEEALSANFTPEAIEEVTIDADGLMSDIHCSGVYRARLVNVLARRAVTQANR
jgi:carbon-monoxide dehydrogenase medium subunit